MHSDRWRLTSTRTLAGAAFSALAITGVAPADAAGLFVTEMATPDLGTAAAGRGAVADNAATAFGNPAGMAFLQGSQVLAGLQGGYGNVNFDRGSDTTVSGGNGGNAVGGFPGSGFYGVYEITPDLKVGLSVGSNFGGNLEYEKGWSGRYYGTLSELLTFSTWPVASYKINDWVSIGGGPQITYGLLNYKTAVRNVSGGQDGQIQLDESDFGAGGIAGVLVQPVAGTRIGVTYTSPIDLSFKGRPDLSGGGPVFNALDPRISQSKIDLGLTIPQTVTVSGYQDLTPDIAVMANAGWQNWSQFGQPTLEVDSTTSHKATANLNYDDTWSLGLGGRYRFAPDWMWSLGFSYDSSPMSKSERSPILPMDQQFRVGTGVQYVVTEHATVGAAYEYANLGEADLDRDKGALSGRLQGNYSPNEVHFFNVTLSWVF